MCKVDLGNVINGPSLSGGVDMAILRWVVGSATIQHCSEDEEGTQSV